MLDTLRPVTTPELIELQLRPAGVAPRALALMLDFAIRTGITLTIGGALEPLGGFGLGALLVLYFVLEWFYPVLFEVYGGGATPGKRALGLVVLHEDGTPVRWGPSLARNLLRAADFLPFLYGFGVVSMLLHSEFRRLGDIVAGTVVVHREAHSGLPRIVQAPAIAPVAPLGRATERALIAFAERAERLTPERREELATLLPHIANPVADAAIGAHGSARLLGLANHLIGRRA